MRELTGYYVDNMSYHGNMFIRFFSWPKTVIFGNIFYYPIKENNCFYKEKRRPSSNWFTRQFAWLLYPFFNPISFTLNFIVTYFHRGIIFLPQDSYKRMIVNYFIKQPAGSVHEKFHQVEEQLQIRWRTLLEKINDVSHWQNPTNLSEFHSIYMEALKNFPRLVNTMKEKVAEEGLDTSQAIANRIARLWSFQHTMSEILSGNSRVRRYWNTERIMYSPVFCNDLLYSMLFEMYHHARAKAVYDDGQVFIQSSMNKQVYAQEFYKKNTLQYQWRQGFNTSMKLFFSQFGGEQFRFFLQKADPRIERWMRIDTSKKDLEFTPCPVERPAYW